MKKFIGSPFFLTVQSKRLDPLHIFFFVVFVQSQRLLLGWAINIWLVFQQFLNSQQNLLHRYMGLPVFFLVEDRETHSSWWIDVGMGKNRFEYALRRTHWVVMSKIHWENIAAAFPRTILGSWNLAVPFKHVGWSVIIFDGFGDEAEGMIAPPLFALFFESVDD